MFILIISGEIFICQKSPLQEPNEVAVTRSKMGKKVSCCGYYTCFLLEEFRVQFLGQILSILLRVLYTIKHPLKIFLRERTLKQKTTISFNIQFTIIFYRSYHVIEKVNTLRTGDVDLRFYITTVQDGWRKSAFLTRVCFPCTIHLIMQYIEPVSEWSCWRMFIENWPHSELTFRHRSSSI